MNKQKGSSTIGLIAIIALAGIALTLGIKLGPLYMANNSLNQAITSAAKTNFNDLTKSEIREKLSKSFSVNGINANPRDFEITQTPSVTEINYVHEERVNIFDNVDVVITFTNSYSTAD